MFDAVVPPVSGRILLVEDDASFLRPLAELLRREGYQCHLAGDVPAARESLREAEVDLVIADIHMPGNCELEFVQHVAKAAPGLPVILLTGAPSVQTAVKAVRLPVVAYLVKPPDFAELAELAAHAIENHRVARAAKASRQRLQEWSRDLRNLENRLSRRPEASRSGAVHEFLGVALDHLLSSLIELHQLSQALVTSAAEKDTVARASMLALLQRTVEVLERTKRSFKSEDLRDLRKEIQRLIDGLDGKASKT